MCGRRRPIAAVEVLFLAIEHQLDRHAGVLRQPRTDDAFRVRGELAAEPAAHVLRDHADIGCGDLEAARVAVARAVHGLRRHPRGELVSVPLAHGAVRLEADVRDDVRGIRLLDNVRGLLESGVEVTGFCSHAGPRVAAHEDDRRVGRHRLLDVGQMRQRLVAHAHKARGVLCALFGVGGHGGHRITLIHALRADLFVHERGLHARRLLRFGEIDRHHARVRKRRAHDLAVDHPGAIDVVGEFGASRDFVRGIEPFDRGADEDRLLGPLPLVGDTRRGRRSLTTTALRILSSHEPPPWLSSPLP